MKEIKCREHLDNMARIGTRPSLATYKKIMVKVYSGEPITDFQLRKAWEYLAHDFAEPVPRALRIRTSQWLEKQYRLPRTEDEAAELMDNGRNTGGKVYGRRSNNY